MSDTSQKLVETSAAQWDNVRKLLEVGDRVLQPAELDELRKLVAEQSEQSKTALKRCPPPTTNGERRLAQTIQSLIDDNSEEGRTPHLLPRRLVNG